jgi:RHS repeat-associated protein
MNHTRNNDRLTVAGHLIRRPASLAVRLRMETVMPVKWLAVIADGDTGICELPFVSPTESGSERRVNMTISRTAPLSAQPAGRAGSTTKVCKVKNRPLSNLNQLASREVPALVDVLGVSLVTNTVTVNGQPAYRKAEYFRQQLAADNSASSLWFNLIVAATGQTRVTGNVYVAQSPEQFSYDPDGNLTNDGRWAYTWDAENRLITMTVNTNVGPQYQLAFAYDPKGRRIQKTVATNGVAVSTNKFLYDGWNLVAELQPNNARIRSYVWGNDLSGSTQGGGVGGLLEVSYYGTATTNCFPAYDGNGNVAALINAADGTIAANYEYAAFGEPIRVTGVMARNNPFRFSTKYSDDESDLLYYGYRYYKAGTGTWPNRDPLGEESFFRNLIKGFPVKLVKQIRLESLMPIYVCNKNDSVNKLDWLGLFEYSSSCSDGDKKAMDESFKNLCGVAKKKDCFRCLNSKVKNKINDICNSNGAGIKVDCQQGDGATTMGTPLGTTSSDGTIILYMKNIRDKQQDPACTLFHESGHAAGVGADGFWTPFPDNGAYAITRCVGCPGQPVRGTLPPGYENY